MRKFVFALICCNFLSAGELPPTWTLTDSLGNPAVRVVFERFGAIKYHTCDVVATVTNIAGGPITLYWIDGKVRFVGLSERDDRSIDLYPAKRDLSPGETTSVKGEIVMQLAPGISPFSGYATVESITLKLGGFKSPQDLEREKKERAEEQQRQKKLEAERDAARAQLQRGCAIVYRNTIDKAQRDLTVREAKQIDYCVLQGWYGPE